MRKFIASTTIAASVVGGGFAGLALIPTIAGAQDSAETETGQPKSGFSSVLGNLVTNGTLTQDQADAVETALVEARQNGVIGHRHPRAHRFFSSDVFANLGIEPEAIRAGRADGLTLGEIADANGSSAEALTAALAQAMTDRLDAAVEAGKVDADRAAERAERIHEKVDDIVTGEFPGRRGRGARGPAGAVEDLGA